MGNHVGGSILLEEKYKCGFSVSQIPSSSYYTMLLCHITLSIDNQILNHDTIHTCVYMVWFYVEDLQYINVTYKEAVIWLLT